MGQQMEDVRRQEETHPNKFELWRAIGGQIRTHIWETGGRQPDNNLGNLWAETKRQMGDHILRGQAEDHCLPHLENNIQETSMGQLEDYIREKGERQLNNFRTGRQRGDHIWGDKWKTGQQ